MRQLPGFGGDFYCNSPARVEIAHDSAPYRVECLYEVAHKYGMDIKSSNDAAIVYYGERPYVLVILTDYLLINTQSFMNRISSDVFKIHEYICDSSRWE